MTYSDKLKDPRWIEKRDRVLARDNHRCQICRIGCKTESLHVHHRWYYPGKEPWEYNMRSLITVCKTCHEPGKAPNLNKLIKNMQAIRAIAKKKKPDLKAVMKLAQQNLQLYQNIIGKSL